MQEAIKPLFRPTISTVITLVQNIEVDWTQWMSMCWEEATAYLQLLYVRKTVSTVSQYMFFQHLFQTLTACFQHRLVNEW